MKKLFLVLFLLGAVDIQVGFSQIPPSKENRFLFVVETSSSMYRSAKTERESVRQLIANGLQGQMHVGDTLGLWTFHEKLNPSFPMQRWSPTESSDIADKAVNFLTKVGFAKKGQSKAFLPPLFSVIAASKAITIVIISSGKDQISGTPFDKEINDVFQFYGKDFQNSKTPFVTVLVGRNEKLVAYSVNSSIGPIQIPRVPVEPEPVVSQSNTNTILATNTPPVTKTSIAPPPRRIAKSNIILTGPTVSNPAPISSPVETPNREIKPDAPEISEPPDVIEKTAKLLPAPNPPKENAIASVPTPTQPIHANPDSVVQQKIEATPAKNIKPKKIETVVPYASAKPELIAKTPDVVHQNVASIETNLTAQSAKKNSSNPASSAVVATEMTSRPKNFFVLGAVFVGLALILIVFVTFNSRNKSRSSLISSSMSHLK